MAAHASSSAIIAKQRSGCITICWPGEICRIDDSHAVKHPEIFFPGHPAFNERYRDLITLERNIYERLGNHKGIIKYLGIVYMKTGVIKLAYAKQGDLATYIRNHDMPSQSFRDGWIQLLVEPFYHIYCCKFSTKASNSTHTCGQRLFEGHRFCKRRAFSTGC